MFPLSAPRRDLAPSALADERGFSLIELLVVIMIIGILAAIALPNFLNQREKAMDSRAKADARNAVTQVEACYTDGEDYRKCRTAADLGVASGVLIGSARGQVSIESDDKSGFVVTAHSQTGTTFTVTKASTSWAVTRSCAVQSGSNERGGCVGGSW